MSEKQYKPLTLRLPKELHRAAKIKSVTEETSLNAIVIQKLKEWVAESHKPTPRKDC